MGDDRASDDHGNPGDDRRRGAPRPTHPRVASFVLVVGTVVVLFLLALMSTLR
jgi:hypothetical protein